MSMKRTQLRSKDLSDKIEKYPFSLTKKDTVELIEEGDLKVIYINKKPCFFYYEDKILPTLQLLQAQLLLKKIVVDMGAIKFIVGGADVMRPGIVSFDEAIEKDDIVVVVDQMHQKPLAVGIALFSSVDLKTMTKGKVIKTIHYVGDEIWKFEV